MLASEKREIFLEYIYFQDLQIFSDILTLKTYIGLFWSNFEMWRGRNTKWLTNIVIEIENAVL